MKNKVNKLYFSLIDLVCLTAIVATLVAMLMSTTKVSKDVAMQAVCMSNLSQIRNYTELYRKDNNSTPYSETWLTDFSYVTPYLTGHNDLSVFTCPGSDDEDLENTDELKSKTSYYYVPGRDVLASNYSDGQQYGFNLLNIASLSDKNQLVIYDRSPNHHNGKINTAYLFGNDDTGIQAGEIAVADSDDFLSLDGAGLLNLSDPETYGSLNINPAKSSGNLFTLTDVDGNIVEIRDDSIAGYGMATSITIKVKSQGRTLIINDEEIELKTNSSYEINATSESGVADTYYVYKLIQDGNGNGQWWIDLFTGVGSITVTKL